MKVDNIVFVAVETFMVANATKLVADWSPEFAK